MLQGSVQRKRLAVATCRVPKGSGIKIPDGNAADSVRRRCLTVGIYRMPEGNRIKIPDGSAAGQCAVKAHVAQVIAAEAVEKR